MRRSVRLLAAALGAALGAGLLVLPAVPGQADGGRSVDRALVVPPFRAITPDAGTRVKDITVKWSGRSGRDYTEATRVPGIGSVKLVCRPNNTIMKLTADARSRETQMWLTKFEDKDGAPALAVKNARIYKYANADDDGRGGTGRSAHEGLNQRPKVENWARGYAYGLISQRPGRHRPAGRQDLVPATSFYLTWTWNGLNHARPYQSCEFRLRLVTHLGESLGLSWHGDADAADHDQRAVAVPGLGTLAVTCRTGGRREDQWITLEPESDDPGVLAASYADYYEYSGEGRVEDHEEHVQGFELDPITGLVGPIDLPRNGMLRIKYSVGETTRWFYVSSYMVVNNGDRPHLNVCEVAVAGAADQS